MEVITYSKAKANLAKMIKQVCDTHEPMIITSEDGKNVVMISLDDFNAMEETMYLLSNLKNAKRLLDSIYELEAGKGKKRTLKA